MGILKKHGKVIAIVLVSFLAGVTIAWLATSTSSSCLNLQQSGRDMIKAIDEEDVLLYNVALANMETFSQTCS